jgi:hypothetical protein
MSRAPGGEGGGHEEQFLYDKHGREAKVSDLLEKARQEGREEMNDCTCKEKWTFGVVHRKDAPCYWPE